MKQNIKKDYIFNTIGSIAYSIVSVVLSIVVIRIIGKVEGGIFSFGYSTLAQQIFCVTYFGVKTIHIIDVDRKFTFKEYKIHRLTTTIISIVISFAYLSILYLTRQYNLIKSIILFILMFHGIFEGYFDVYEAEFQRNSFLYIAGISLLLRTLLWTTVFLIILISTKNLLISAIVGMSTKFLSGYFYDKIYGNRYLVDESNIVIDKKKAIIDITKEAWPLFVTIFLDSFVFSASKYAVERYLGDVSIGFYTFMFLPATGVYMLNYMLIRPFITPLSEAYLHNIEEYKKIVKKLIKWTTIICLIIVLLVVVLSNIYIRLMNIFTNNIYDGLYGQERLILFFVICGGAFYAIYIIYYYLLIIENKKKMLLVIYIISTLIAMFLSIIFVKTIGVLGGAISFALTIFILMIVAIITHKVNMKRKMYV